MFTYNSHTVTNNKEDGIAFFHDSLAAAELFSISNS